MIIKNKKKSKNYGKVMLIFERTIDTDEIQEKIKEIRIKLNIPIDGFDFNGELKFPEINEFVYETHGNGFVVKSHFIREFNKIKHLFPVLNFHLETLLRNYIYYNKLLKKELDYLKDEAKNICELIDADKEEEFLTIDEDEDFCLNVFRYNESVREFLLEYPVSIRIRHDTSIGALLSFIKNNSKYIKNIQNKYVKDEQFSHINSKAGINSLIKERDDFIYKNKNISRKKLWELLNKKYKNALGLEYASLAKIISRENKRRLKK